jgi:dolichol-phosphate mannosyltransferase
VVPTRNEAGNVQELVRQLAALPIAESAEVIFVDDSTDETPATIAALRPEHGLEVVLIHRTEHERAGGLGGAVVRGIQVARAPWVCVMDGDLQHPPNLIPTMLDRVAADDADLVLASRYVGDGDASAFGRFRAMASEGSTLVAKTVLADRLRGISDPMSGFFLLRRDAIDLGLLKPDGFKILIEIVGRMPGLRVAEVPFTFRERYDGESKASPLEAVRLGRTLVKHRLGERGIRLVKFALVGASGVVVNEGMLAVGVHLLSLHIALAVVLATLVSIGSNFVLAETWVFKAAGDGPEAARRGVLFLGLGLAGLALQAPLLWVLVELAGLGILFANLVSLITLMLARFAIADRAIWSERAARPARHARRVAVRSEAS